MSEIRLNQNSDISNAIVPVNEANPNNQYVKSTVDQYIGIEYKNQEENIEICNLTIDSNEKIEKEHLKTEQNVQTQNLYDQKFVQAQATIGEMPHSEFNGCYSNANYEYDYHQNSVQQQSQYYIYQSYQDFSQVPNIAGKNKYLSILI